MGDWRGVTYGGGVYMRGEGEDEKMRPLYENVGIQREEKMNIK